MAEPMRRTTIQPVDARPEIDRLDVHADRPEELHYPIPEAANLARDRVRWGPILAGFVTALTSLVLLGMLGLALGLTSVNAYFDAARGAPPPEVGRNSAIWAGISSILAFLIGGFVAGRTAAVFDRGWGTLNGMLVFLFAVPVMLWLAGQGLGAIMGTVGSFTAGLQVDPGTAQSATSQAAQGAQQAASSISPADISRAAETARTAAWGGLVGSLLALGAAGLGGALGTRREIQYERYTGAVHE